MDQINSGPVITGLDMLDKLPRPPCLCWEYYVQLHITQTSSKQTGVTQREHRFPLLTVCRGVSRPPAAATVSGCNQKEEFLAEEWDQDKVKGELQRYPTIC